MKSYILLENVVFYANHGVVPQETIVGNEYIINLKIGIDLSKAGQSDDLQDTVSYADMYEDIKAEMAMPSKLLEHVAYRIVKRLRGKYEKIESLEIKLSKRNPPMGAQIDCAAVYLEDK
ncbi:MAG: dihydroneopterin aldolase [Prevotella sp.]|jgi:dihydroneopterin aldolase|nr:dihydroneopterin aldolase [Prevotella sp.]